MRTTLVPAWGNLAMPFPLPLLRSASGQPWVLPVYHLSTDDTAPHIRHIYPVRNVRLFRKDMDFFLRHFHPIDFEAVKLHVLEKKPIKTPSFFLSFDDGLREIYDEVAPVLWEKGIPAAFFVNSAFVDNQGLFFRYKASLLVDRLKNNSFSVACLSQLENLLTSYLLPPKLSLTEKLMRIGYGNQAILDEAATLLEVNFDEFLSTQKPYLTKNQIQELKNEGFTIGAHSMDHPEYRFISPEQQQAQTHGSLVYLRQELDITDDTFAFPFTDFGVRRKFFEDMYSAGKVSISFGCAGIKKDSFSRHLQRLPMEGTLLPAEKIVKGEYLYYLLKKPLGKNRLLRD
ncbi:MAG: polysaccharide deacetylase family protein [Bacteroidia bacterium]|nr:polysaccharide deacetylase family protein [Bacteroidia bacterium]